MSGWTFPRWTAVACCVALNTMCSLSAQDPGVGMVRISDGPAGGVQQAGHHKHGGYAYSDGGMCPSDGACPQCRGSGCKHCFGHGCQHGCLGCCLGNKFQEHYCTNSPDYGYSIPGKYPIERRGVQYVNYFPASWYGSGGGGAAVAYPMVYQPTDTTQLGFYYQHVPFWMPQPNPLPRRSPPAHWHNYAPAVPASAFHSGYWRGNAFDGCPVAYGAPAAGSPTPVDPSLQTVPSEPPPAPRPPVHESAADSPFRRASYNGVIQPLAPVQD
jgi:hypothetical protein